jgi:redox-sensitive bicupin YhaK (pirin superfamily)
MPTDPLAGATVHQSRSVQRLVAGQPTQDGAGVKLTRVLTADLQQRLDPFLMLDAFGSDTPGDYIAGFPEHPHRGFETITYMVQGRMRHRDSAGHEGLLSDGGVQWMTAGRGVIHSEMPEQTEGRMAGFQLWLNLAAADKMQPPAYQDIASALIPEVRLPGALLRVIAGASRGVAGAVQRPVTEPIFLDIHLQPEATLTEPLPPGHHGFVFVYQGPAWVGSTRVPQAHMGILAQDGDGLSLRAGAAAVRALLIAGAPLREPIAQLGPFVMNTRAELLQAVDDYRAGRLA